MSDLVLHIISGAAVGIGCSFMWIGHKWMTEASGRLVQARAILDEVRASDERLAAWIREAKAVMAAMNERTAKKGPTDE